MSNIQERYDPEIERHGGSFAPVQLKMVWLAGKEVRAFVVSKDEYYFNATDVCKALKISDAKQFRSRLPEDQCKTLQDVVGGYSTPPLGVSFTKTFGALPQSIYLGEAAMWLGALEGRSEACKSLRWFIADKVMPQIARTGSFIGTLEDQTIMPFLIDNGFDMMYNKNGSLNINGVERIEGLI